MSVARLIDPVKYEKDKRHFLYREYLRIIAAHRPPVFVLENVTGMLSSRIGGDKIIDRILRDLRHPGAAINDPTVPDGLAYHLHSVVQQPKGRDLYHEPVFDPRSFIVECEKYGVPQARHRVIILGIRSDLKAVPQPLTPHGRPVNLSEVIGDLPPLRSELSRRASGCVDWREAVLDLLNNGVMHDDSSCPALRSEVLTMSRQLGHRLTTGSLFVQVANRKRVKYRDDWYVDPRLGGVCNHEARTHMESDVRRYFFASCYARVNSRSPVLSEFPKSLLPKHQNVSQGVKGEVFADRFRVQLPDRPATTVTSHIAKDGHYYIHPDPAQCRSLTVREAARIQTFPDNYCFLGPRTSQYQQVGNAVPPLLAHQLAQLVKSLLD
jgi:DNA (cytosine-5)-methyltransferase 1